MRFKTLAAALLVLLAVASGAVAAQTVHDKTYSVDNNTSAVFVDIEDSNGSDIEVTIYGVDGSTETQVDNATLSAGANETASYSYSKVNASKYPEYRVVVDAPTDAPASVNSGTESGTMAGGGSVQLNETYFGVPLWAFLAFAVFALLAIAGDG
jgi:hypothetical protein